MSQQLLISREAMRESMFVAAALPEGVFHVVKNRLGAHGYASTAGMLRNLLAILDESEGPLVIAVMPRREKIKS